MTDQRNRQPKGVSTGGQFAPESKSEDTSINLAVQDRLDDGDYQEFAGDGNVVQSYEISRDGNSYSAYAKLGDMNVKRLLGATEETEEEQDHFERVMTVGRWSATEDFIKSRYPGVELVDGGLETGFDLELSRQYDQQPTEMQVTNDTWDTAATISNEQDPGTYGSEYLGRLLQEHLDQQAFAERPPMEVGGRWIPSVPIDGWEVERAVNLSNKHGIVLDHRAAGAIAERSKDKDPVFAQLASKGYADRSQLAEASMKHLESGERTAMNRFAADQQTVSELMGDQGPSAHTSSDPEHHQLLTTERSAAWEEKRGWAIQAVREAVNADKTQAVHGDPERIQHVLKDQSFLDDAFEEARSATEDNPEHFGSHLAHLAGRRADGWQ